VHTEEKTEPHYAIALTLFTRTPPAAEKQKKDQERASKVLFTIATTDHPNLGKSGDFYLSLLYE
jgi:hypothetical protein